MAGIWSDEASLRKVPEEIEMERLGLSWGQGCCKDEKLYIRSLVLEVVRKEHFRSFYFIMMSCSSSQDKMTSDLQNIL